MNDELVGKIAQAVLYEGYILYPYRPSVKNHHRWTFGGLYPKAYCESQRTGDTWSLVTECIILGSEASTVEVKARFLHLIDRKVATLTGSDSQLPAFVDSVSVGGKKYQRWQEAMERAVVVPPTKLAEILTRPMRRKFSFPACQSREDILDGEGRIAAVLIREQQSITGVVEISAGKIRDGAFRLSVRIANSGDMGLRHGATFACGDSCSLSPEYGGEGEGNRSPQLSDTRSGQVSSLHTANVVGEYAHPTETARQVATNTLNKDTAGPPVPRQGSRDEALIHALVSTHAILGVNGGQFISMTDPPDELKDLAADCKNVGVWPVLVGEAGASDAILASPIILYDYPQIAPESPGDLFDGGEIDEILSLRILTLTDEEKRDVSSVDQRADVMLKRTENLAREQLMNLHGGMRNTSPFPAADILPEWDPMADRPRLPSIRTGGVELHPGDRVRLRPSGGADAFDMMLDGKIATIAVIEQDYEDRIHLAVTVEDDPGADFGVAGKPGHRFFFRPDEVEPVLEETRD